MKLIHDVPKNQGVANAIKRAYQITDCRWYARRNTLPSSHSLFRQPAFVKSYADTYVRAFVPQKGMLYSAARKDDQFVGFAVTPETYMTALTNPNSVLYTRCLHGTKGSVGCYYGMVCSCMVSYVTGQTLRIPCRDWLTWPGVTELDPTDLDKLELCDILDCTTAHDHITIITDIARDEEGHVQLIEVSESTTSHALRRQFDLPAFHKYWLEKNFKLYRMADLSHVTFTPSKWLPVRGEEFFQPEDMPLMTDRGHKASYLLGQDKVELTVLHGDWDTIVVTCPDGTEVTLPAPALAEHKQDVFPGKTVTQTYSAPIAVDCPTVGHYKAVLKKGDTLSEAVEWHVHSICLKADKAAYKVGEPITLTYENAEDDDVFEYLVNFLPSNAIRTYSLFDGGKKGTVTLPGITKPGYHWAVVISKNDTCCYTSNKVFFDVEV